MGLYVSAGYDLSLPTPIELRPNGFFEAAHRQFLWWIHCDWFILILSMCATSIYLGVSNDLTD